MAFSGVARHREVTYGRRVNDFWNYSDDCFCCILWEDLNRVIKETTMTELAIIILTMVLLLGAVIVEELRMHTEGSEKKMTSNWLSKLSGGRSSKQ